MNFKHRKLTFSLLLMLSYMPTTYANIATFSSPTPGGIAIVPLPPVANNSPPLITYNGNRVLTIKDTDSKTTKPLWFAVVGVPLSVKPGTQAIKMHTANSTTQKLAFKITPKSYPIEKINFKGYKPSQHKQVYHLTKLDLRILRELKEIETTYRHWKDANNITKLQLQLPIHGRKSSAFGLKRILNGMPKSPHSGLDIAAPEGTQVRAPKDGTILKTSNYFLTGNAVFIDHGQGFISSYFHLKKIYVKIGSKIKQGQVLGLVGKTGRATGPHLHWSVSLNGVRVNPVLFLPKKDR